MDQQTIPNQPVTGTNQQTKPNLQVALVIIICSVLTIAIATTVYFSNKGNNDTSSQVTPTPTTSLVSNKQILQILDTKNVSQAAAETIKNDNTAFDCQPHTFDPETTAYTASSTANEYEVKLNNNTYTFTLSEHGSSGYVAKIYTFGCASSFDYIVDLRTPTKRIALYDHVIDYGISSDDSTVYVDYYLLNSQKTHYVRTRQLFDINDKKSTTIPAYDCVSRYALWSENTLLTYSDKAFAPQNGADYETKICVWNQAGELLSRLQGQLTWYGASTDVLWGTIGILPSDSNILYVYEGDQSTTPTTCTLYLQDISNQTKKKSLALFTEDGEMPQHICPSAVMNGITFDLTNTTFENATVKYKRGENEWKTVQ